MYKLELWVISNEIKKSFTAVVPSVDIGLDVARKACLQWPYEVFGATVKDTDGEICAAMALEEYMPEAA